MLRLPVILYPKAVELPGRHVNYPGSQIVPIQFFWGHHTDDDIGEEMKKLAEKLRPVEWKGPQRRGRGKASTIESLLDALSAMRLASYYPKTSQGQRAGSRSISRALNAIDLFSQVRLGRVKTTVKRKSPEFVVQTNFDVLTARARQLFREIFGGQAENGSTWTERKRMRKSARFPH